MSRVSVVVPTFDRRPLLQQAVESVLSQTHESLEVIVVDDGSTDATSDYLASIDDPRVHVIRRAHTGNVSALRNAGIEAASCDLLAFLDSDDVWLPHNLERQIAALRGANDAVWCYAGFAHIDAAGRRIPARAGHFRAVSGWIAPPLLEADLGVTICSLLVPTSLVRDVAGFDESLRMREDYELIVRIALRAPAAGVDDVLTLVRDHARRTTRGMTRAAAHVESARTFAAVLDHIEAPKLRAIASRRRGEHLAEAGREYLHAGEWREARTCFAESRRNGIGYGPIVRQAMRGAAAAGSPVRAALRPVIGRESSIWRFLPWPRLRLAFFTDPVDCIIHALLASRRRTSFVQIGSHDGRTNDPLWTFRNYGTLRGVLVEPMPRAFEQLRSNHRGRDDRFTFVHAAVAERPGVVHAYHLPDAPHSSSDQDQIASLDREHVAQHAPYFGFGPDDVVATPVPAITLHELLAFNGPGGPDLLHIDAEGQDERILLELDLTRTRPAVIMYEHVHLRSDRAEHRLHDAGYDTARIGADTIAVSGAALHAHRALRTAWRIARAHAQRAREEQLAAT